LEDARFTRRCARDNRAGLRRIESGLREIGLEWVPSEANFILVRVGDGAGWFAALQRKGVIVRPLAPYKLPEWLRITVGTADQNERLLREMAALAAAGSR